MGGSSGKQTIGYRYFMGLHFGLCLGPVDAFLALRGGDRTAWAGNVTSSQPIEVNAPGLWGGEKKEGGIQGTLDVMMGEPTQGANAYLASQFPGTPMPAFRGMLSLVFRKGLIGCMNPYPKPWKFRVRRILKGWAGEGVAWYPERAEIDLGGAKAMNPAHIVYEALTNPDWGMGYPAGVLDAVSFAAAADTFHAEGMGLCFQWVRSNTIEGFVQDVMNHAGGVVAQDPRSGLFRLLPIRGDYTVASLPEFRRGLNVLAVENFERAAITETVNELTVNFTEVGTGKPGLVTVQQLANIQAQGGVVSQSMNYQGLPTAALATRVALRDLAARSQPLCKVRLLVDRSGYGILPGEVVRWTDDKLGILDMPMRVLQVNYGSLTAGAIALDLAEDVYGLPLTTYLAQQPDGWEEPPTEPVPAPAVEALELPYVVTVAELGSDDAQALPATAGYLGMAAAEPAGVNYGFALYTRVGSVDYAETGTGDWAAGGPLLAGITRSSTVLTLDPPRGLEEVSEGDLAMLGTGALAELVRVDAVNVAGGTVTVARGCGDTLARPWPLGTRLWVIESSLAISGTEFALGELVDAKAATQAPTGTLELSLAPTDSVTMAQRQARPYPPGRVRIAAAAEPAAVAESFVVTWAHRDRLVQADQLVDGEAASIGPEPGTSYALRLLNATTSALLVEKLDIAGDTATVSLAYTGDVRLVLYSRRDGLESWQKVERTFAYTPAPGAVESTITAGTFVPDEYVLDGGGP